MGFSSNDSLVFVRFAMQFWPVLLSWCCWVSCSIPTGAEVISWLIFCQGVDESQKMLGLGFLCHCVEGRKSWAPMTLPRDKLCVSLSARVPLCSSGGLGFGGFEAAASGRVQPAGALAMEQVLGLPLGKPGLGLALSRHHVR